MIPILSEWLIKSGPEKLEFSYKDAQGVTVSENRYLTFF
jgi:hypothetical protein